MSKKDDIPVFPISGYQIGPLKGYDALVMKLQYLSSPMQSLDQAQETNFFALSPTVVRGIISDLQKHLETLEKSEIQSPQGKKH
ncbi:bssS family protein [Providencia rettgeri]